MAHNIDESTGQAACMVVGTPPWHKLGKNISAAVTSKEAMQLAILDWHVIQESMFLADGTKVPSKVANLRSDTRGILGVVGKNYTPFQNADCFDFMDALVNEKLAMFETAGALNNGKQVWMMARIPKELRAGQDDVILPYVLCTNGHDGTKALKMFATSIRVVCQNTLNLSLRRDGTDAFTLYHHQNIHDRVNEARTKLGLIVNRFDSFQTEIAALAAKSLPETAVTNYFTELFPVKRRLPDEKVRLEDQSRALVAELLSQQADDARSTGREFIEEILDRQSKRNSKIIEELQNIYRSERNTGGSAWTAYNSVSEWADHQKPTRGKDEASRDNNRLNSIWFGQANTIKQEAYQKAIALTN